MSDDTREILYIALTRPSLFWGAPVEGVGMNFVSTLLLGWCFQMGTGFPAVVLWLAWGVPAHFVMRWATSFDWHWARAIMLWGKTIGRGHTTLVSLPRQRPINAKDIPTSA